MQRVEVAKVAHPIQPSKEMSSVKWSRGVVIYIRDIPAMMATRRAVAETKKNLIGCCGAGREGIKEVLWSRRRGRCTEAVIADEECLHNLGSHELFPVGCDCPEHGEKILSLCKLLW